MYVHIPLLIADPAQGRPTRQRALKAIIIYHLMSVPQLKRAMRGTLGTERARIGIDDRFGRAERHYYHHTVIIIINARVCRAGRQSTTIRCPVRERIDRGGERVESTSVTCCSGTATVSTYYGPRTALYIIRCRSPFTCA